MEDHTMPEFEDLEPEGGYFDDDGHHDRAVGKSSDTLKDSPMRPENQFEYHQHNTDSEHGVYVEGDRSQADRPKRGLVGDKDFHQKQPPLSNLAARIALEWGAKAHTRPWGGGNSRRSKARYKSGASRQISSAYLQETYEMIETLALAAASSNDELEALGLIAAMSPLAVALVPETYRALWPAIPVLLRGTMGLTRLLHRRPSTRHYLQLMPEILLQTTDQLSVYALEEGRPVPTRLAARLLAHSTEAVLASRMKKLGRSNLPGYPSARKYDEP